LDERVTFVGRMRGDAALYDPAVPRARKGKRGRKPQKGPRLPKPKEAAAKADRKRTATGEWAWQAVTALAYGCWRHLRAVSYEAVWPRVLGLRRIRVIVVRDPEGRMRDCYLFMVCSPKTGPGGMRVSEALRGQETIHEAPHG